MKLVGVDIGGTSIKLGLFDKNGNEQQLITYDTESNASGPYIVHKLIEQIEQFKSFDAIGVSSAGHIDRENGVIEQCPNIPHLAGVHMKAELEKYFHVPVAVENDVNAAALGESYYGVGKKYCDFLFLTYGTGIGGAIVHDSTLFYGRDGFAAEFGHMITHAKGRKCNCGRLGCYETYASTSALINEAKQINPSFTNGRIIMDVYHQGDGKMIQVIANWIEEIVIGLTSLVHIFNPSTIIIGGGIMEQEQIVKRVSNELNNKIIDSYREVNVRKASLGNKAGMLGAISVHLS